MLLFQEQEIPGGQISLQCNCVPQRWKYAPPQVSALNNAWLDIILLIIFIFGWLTVKTCSITDISMTPSQLGWRKSTSIVPSTSLHQLQSSTSLNKLLWGWRLLILIFHWYPPLMITHFCKMRLFPYNCLSLGIEVSHDPLTCKFNYIMWLCLQTLPSTTSSPITLSLQ